MKKELIAYKNPKSPIAEIFRTLRTNIQFMNSNKSLKTLLVTSTMPAEGKTWVSANLAITFAQAGKKVLLIDADMRKGRIHKMFQIDQAPGLSNYLSGISEVGAEEKNDIFSYVKNTEVENLYAIPSGNVPPNPSELLASETTNNMLEKLKEVFDVIIFDGTPSLLVTDAIILARIVDSTIIVTAHKFTKKDNLQKIKRSIENVGGKIAGVVLNKIPVNIEKYRSSYYYSSSSNSNTEKNEIREIIEETSENLNTENANNSNKYIVETNDSISKEKTENIMKQLDDYLKNNSDKNNL